MSVRVIVIRAKFNGDSRDGFVFGFFQTLVKFRE